LGTDQWVNGSPRSSGWLSATLINARTCSLATIGIGPRGLDGTSNRAKPRSLKESRQRYTDITLQPTRSATATTDRPAASSPTIR
jgi:hypothetical protein